MSSPAKTLNRSGLLAVPNRIIKAHTGHFTALSFLFFLPLSFSVIFFPTFLIVISQSDKVDIQILPETLLHFYTTSPTKAISLSFLYTIFVFILSLCGSATITYSAYQEFYGRPINFLSTIKSLSYSFFPLVSTSVAAQILLALTCLVFVLFAGSVLKAIEILGFEIDYNSHSFTWFCVIASILFGLVLVIYFQANWVLAGVIAVAESEWGFEPIRRSTYLMRGMRSVSLPLLLLQWIVIWFIMIGTWIIVLNSGISVWRSWVFIFQIVYYTTGVTSLMVANVTAKTVLYVCCKAQHGESGFKTREDFSNNYVRLAIEDDEVSKVEAAGRARLLLFICFFMFPCFVIIFLLSIGFL